MCELAVFAAGGAARATPLRSRWPCQLCSRRNREGLQPIMASPLLWLSVCLCHLLCAQDLPLLDLRPARITFASDYFEQMIKTATGLIQAGFMYADDTPTEEVRDW